MPRLPGWFSVLAFLLAIGFFGSTLPVTATPRYTLVYLATTNGVANDINNHHQIVGVVDGHAVLWTNRVMTLLPVPDWVVGSEAVGINERGQIAGRVWSAQSEIGLPAIWTDGKLIVLPGGQALTRGINNRGEVVGQLVTVLPSGDEISYPALWNHGKLMVLPGGQGAAFAINNQGQIVGVVGGNPVRWDHGTVTTLPTERGGFPGGINEYGQIVGGAYDLNFASFIVTWKHGVVTRLGSDLGFARSINDRGQIVGGISPSETFLWEDGVFMALPVQTYGDPFSINEHAEIVGQADGVPALWTPSSRD